MTGSATATVKRWNRKAVKEANRVIRESVADVVADAQSVQGVGGRMRVRTGFLRASVQGSVTGMPVGPTRGELKEPDSYPDTSIAGLAPAVALALWKPMSGLPFYVGWTANYAVYREASDGFLRSALSKWDLFVEANAGRLF